MLGVDLFFRIFLRISPRAVIEIDCKPVVGDRSVFNARVLCVAINGAPRELPGLPTGVRHRSITKLQDETTVSDVCIGVFHPRFGIGVVLCHHRDCHGISWQDVDRDHVVRDKLDRIDGNEFSVHVQHEPVIGVDVGLDRVRHLRLFQLAGLSRRAFVLTLSQRDDRACGTDEQTADNCQTLHENVLSSEADV